MLFKLWCCILLVPLLSSCASYMARSKKYNYSAPFYQSIRNPDTIMLCYSPFLCPVFAVDYVVSAAVDTALLPIDYGLYLYGKGYYQLIEQKNVGAFTVTTFRDINRDRVTALSYNSQPLPPSLLEGEFSSCFADNGMLDKNTEVSINKTTATLFIFNNDMAYSTQPCSYLLQEKQGKLITQKMPRKYLLGLDYNQWTYNTSTEPNTLWFVDVIHRQPSAYSTWDTSKIPAAKTAHPINNYFWTIIVSISPDKRQAVYMTNDRSALWVVNNVTHTQEMITLSNAQIEHLINLEAVISPKEANDFKAIFHTYTKWFEETYQWQKKDEQWQLVIGVSDQ